MHFQVQDDWDIPTTEELPQEKFVLVSLSNLYLIGVLTSAPHPSEFEYLNKSCFCGGPGHLWASVRDNPPPPRSGAAQLSPGRIGRREKLAFKLKFMIYVDQTKTMSYIIKS